MPDFGSPIAQNINPVGQGVQTLSGLVGLKQQQQALQTGALQQQGIAADVQQKQQQNQELQALSQFTRNASIDPSFHKKDGSLDVEKFQRGASAVAPVYGQAYIGQATNNANSILDNRKALLNLSNEQRATIGNYFGAVAAKPDATRDDFMDAAEQARGVSDDPQYQRAVDRMLMGAPNVRDLPTDQSSAAIRQWSRGIAMETGAPNAAQSGPAISTMQGPAGLQPIQTNPQSPMGIGAVGSSLPQGVAPGAQVVTDAYDNRYLLNPQSNRVTPIGAGKGAGPPQQGGFQQPVAGQQQVLHDIENLRAVGDTGPINRNINQHLLELSNATKTGPGTQTPQKIAAFLGMPSGSSYQEINAYLDRQAAMSARQMGVPNTNAGLAAAQNASGTTEYTPQALQEKVKFADALNSATIAYRQGLDKAIGTGATPNLANYQKFRSAWAQNFDPDVYRAEDAQRRGDKAELAAIQKRLGPKGMQEVGAKSANLRQLENGVIPGG